MVFLHKSTKKNGSELVTSPEGNRVPTRKREQQTRSTHALQNVETLELLPVLMERIIPGLSKAPEAKVLLAPQIAAHLSGKTPKRQFPATPSAGALKVNCERKKVTASTDGSLKIA